MQVHSVTLQALKCEIPILYLNSGVFFPYEVDSSQLKSVFQSPKKARNNQFSGYSCSKPDEQIFQEVYTVYI